ncbi:hypothetical protein [Mesorhizobium sp.]|uniref:DUF7946 domain-containing protein n=1 Tax=Mesorhizobium sp. TaxID=1871066 RepID=UPI000FEA3ECF|nr:hypothetical protein [Mesorhizobium sp.]RWF01771.1 MAG: hypothetical protein EOS43_09940 [Mesorhizobium sp.]
MAKGQFGLKLRFSGGQVEKRGLDLYDGATSFYGFAQALQIVVHAYVNKEVVSRATALRGAEVYFGAPRQGSVIIDIVAFIETYPATLALAAPIFYDFVKHSFSKAAGYLTSEPETPQVSKLSTDDEPFFDELAEALEGSLQRGHRSIDHGVPTISLERPRSSLVIFNKQTSEWVHTRDENPDVAKFTGNVTRYNSITGNGRAYIRQLGKIVPIRPSSAFPVGSKGLLTWSLHGNNVITDKELEFDARRIDSARGDVKRLILVDCRQAALTTMTA